MQGDAPWPIIHSCILYYKTQRQLFVSSRFSLMSVLMLSALWLGVHHVRLQTYLQESACFSLYRSPIGRWIIFILVFCYRQEKFSGQLKITLFWSVTWVERIKSNCNPQSKSLEPTGKEKSKRRVKIGFICTLCPLWESVSWDNR